MKLFYLLNRIVINIALFFAIFCTIATNLAYADEELCPDESYIDWCNTYKDYSNWKNKDINTNGWTITATSPDGNKFNFVPQTTKPSITAYKQNNDWSYLIWEDLGGYNIYAQNPDGIWFTDSNDCFPEMDLDKIRMELDHIITDNRIGQCLKQVTNESS